MTSSCGGRPEDLSHQGPRTCLKCDRGFISADVTRIRICTRCKGGPDWRGSRPSDVQLPKSVQVPHLTDVYGLTEKTPTRANVQSAETTAHKNKKEKAGKKKKAKPLRFKNLAVNRAKRAQAQREQDRENHA